MNKESVTRFFLILPALGLILLMLLELIEPEAYLIGLLVIAIGYLSWIHLIIREGGDDDGSS